MDDNDGKRRMLERQEIVMRMTQINSEQLRRGNEQNGIDIELLIVRSSYVEGDQPPLEDAKKIGELERKIEHLKQRQKEHRVEFENLQRQLLEFDEQTVSQQENKDD